jgi:predicted phage tail protein
MTRETTTRASIAALIYTMTSAVLFGVGIIAVLTVPALNANAIFLIPAVVIASLILGAPAAWIIAPRMRARYWRQTDAGRSAATIAVHPR